MTYQSDNTALATPAVTGLPQKAVASRRSETVLVLSFVFGMTVLLQWLGGAYTAEFSGWPDEPAHYISSLMIRSYIASGLPPHPIKFAENYYLHYPKVAFPIWGPLFHSVAGIWMLPSAGRVSILLLMAAIIAVLAVVLYRVIREQFPPEAGLAAVLLLITVPTVQSATAMVMGDSFCALLDFAACIYFARYLDKEKTRDSILFGVFASLSILAKPSGLATALLPPLALLVTRRWYLMRARAFWYPAVIVLVLCSPWQILEFRLLTGMPRTHEWRWVWMNAQFLVQMLGPVLMVVTVIGVAVQFRKRSVRGIWTSAALMGLSVWAFHSFLPVGEAESRYMLPGLPPMLMFFVAGLYWIAGRLPVGNLSTRQKAGALMLVSLAVFAVQVFRIPHKPIRGFDDVAKSLEARRDLEGKIFLVSSESDGEGIFISAVALRENRPFEHIILRASKVLAQSDWSGARYQALFHTTGDLMRYLQSVPVRIVIVETSPSWKTEVHQQLLLKTVRAFPDHWKSLGTYTRSTHMTAAEQIEIFEQLGVENQPNGPIKIGMPFTWGTPITN